MKLLVIYGHDIFDKFYSNCLNIRLHLYAEIWLEDIILS